MRLMFHIGLNKAGSTYLQDILGLNVAELEAESLYYPFPRVSSGRGGAQSGNATEFPVLLDSKDFGRISILLQEHREAAESASCTSVVLSNESVYHRLVKAGALDDFLAATRGLYDSVDLLIIFRDPGAHAVSAFCHRAGLVPLPDFDTWVRSDWELPAELRLFLANFLPLTESTQEPKVRLTLGTIPGDNLADLTKQWLGLREFKTPQFAKSNVSVNCAEAELLRLVAASIPAKAPRLREALRALDPSLKAGDAEVRRRWRASTAEVLRENSRDFLALEELLHTQVIANSSPTSDSEPLRLSFTSMQAEEIIEVLGEPERFMPRMRSRAVRLLRGARRGAQDTAMLATGTSGGRRDVSSAHECR